MMMTMKGGGRSSAASKRRKRGLPTTSAATAMEVGPAGVRGGAAAAPAAASSSSEAWTEEMHSSFMNRMEAAFVHHILLGSWPAAASTGPHAAANHRPTSVASSAPEAPRLDRYVPDFAESTHDGHRGDVPAAPAPCSTGTFKRFRLGGDTWRHGCTSGDISTLSHGAKAEGTATTRYSDDDDDADQVVPLFQMPEPGGNTAPVDRTATTGGTQIQSK